MSLSDRAPRLAENSMSLAASLENVRGIPALLEFSDGLSWMWNSTQEASCVHCV